jgi:hypothetical protein
VSKLWVAAAFVVGAAAGALAAKLYIQGEIKAAGGGLIDKILPKEYGGAAKNLYDTGVDAGFDG